MSCTECKKARNKLSSPQTANERIKVQELGIVKQGLAILHGNEEILAHVFNRRLALVTL